MLGDQNLIFRYSLGWQGKQLELSMAHEALKLKLKILQPKLIIIIAYTITSHGGLWSEVITN